MAKVTDSADHTMMSDITVTKQKIPGTGMSVHGNPQTTCDRKLPKNSDFTRQSAAGTARTSSADDDESPVPDVMSMRSDSSMKTPINFGRDSNENSQEISVASGSVSAEQLDDFILNPDLREGEDVPCSVCKERACKSCFTCVASFCENHGRPHYKATEFKNHKLVEANQETFERLSACPSLGAINFTSVEPCSISFSWGPLEGSTGPQTYKVHWKCNEDQSSVKISDLDFTVEELIPGKKYEFSISKVMDDGTQGVCVFATTHTGIPKPKNVAVTTDQTSLTVSWSKPKGVDEVKYLLSLQSHGKRLKNISLASTQRSFTDLLMGEEYTVSVCSVLKTGGQSDPVSKTARTGNSTSEGVQDSPENQEIMKTETASSDGRQERLEDLMKDSRPVVSKTRKVFILKTERTMLNDTVRRWTFGERDDRKKNKIIMLVGETGTGKTTLINTLVNHALGVRFDDNMWFEISDEENSTKQTDTQTTHVTVYDVFVEERPFTLTIVDTPGYGDTRGLLHDQLITENLLKLFISDNGVHSLDAICLVLKASMNRLSTTQHYIFNAVLSLFGKDIQGNIVLLITHSTGQYPRNALQAVQEGNIPCARTNRQEPVYFLFDNCQLGEFEEERKSNAECSWIHGLNSIERLYEFIEKQERKSMELTTGVLKERVQLQACVNNLVERIEWREGKEEELKQTQVAIEENEEKIKACEKFTYEVEVVYKEKENIQNARLPCLEGPHGPQYYVDIIWHYFNSKAVCCDFCEENCHHPGCWLAFHPSRCEVMKDQHCTSCTNKCHYDKHVKGNQIYVIKKRMETRTDEDLKRQFEAHTDQSKSFEEIMRKIQEDLQKATVEKRRMVHEAYDCIMKLQEIALAKESVFTLVYLDFLIEKMDEMKDIEKVGKLKEMQKKKAVKQSTLEYVASLLNRVKRFIKKK